MRLTKLAPWLRPTLLAPWLAMSVVVTIGVLVGQHDPLLGGPFANWVIAMFFGSLWAAGISGLLVLVDVVRARGGLPPPTGRPAWWGGALAAGLCMATYAIAPPARHGMPGWLFAVLVPALVSAIASRLLTWRQRADR